METTSIPSTTASTDGLFERASRLSLRFSTTRGVLGTEDLWALPLTSDRPNGSSLNDVAKSISRELKNYEEESFVGSAATAESKAREMLQLKLDIVKRIIAVKIAERDAAKAATEKRAMKTKLLEIRGRKTEAELEGKSLDEIDALIAAL